MPRFVILEHDHPFRHWDLLLEAGPVLRSWRLLSEPLAAPAVLAEPTFDHRLVYLDYEGPVSGGRGHVQRWDRGEFTLVSDSAAGLVVQFAGQRLAGRAHLRPTSAESWRFVYPFRPGA